MAQEQVPEASEQAASIPEQISLPDIQVTAYRQFQGWLATLAGVSIALAASLVEVDGWAKAFLAVAMTLLLLGLACALVGRFLAILSEAESNVFNTNLSIASQFGLPMNEAIEWAKETVRPRPTLGPVIFAIQKATDKPQLKGKLEVWLLITESCLLFLGLACLSFAALV